MLQDQLAAWGEVGLKLGIASGGKLTFKIPKSLPVDEVRSLLRDNRDEILAHVHHLDDRLTAALAILADLDNVAVLTSADRSVIGTYRETVVEVRDRLDPLAGEVEDAARKLAARLTTTRPRLSRHLFTT